jgi:hypothetical protein
MSKRMLMDHALRGVEFHKACAGAHQAIAQAYSAKCETGDDLAKKESAGLHDLHLKLSKLHAGHAVAHQEFHDALKAAVDSSGVEISHQGLPITAAMLTEALGKLVRPDGVHGALPSVPGSVLVPRAGAAPLEKAVDLEPELAEVIGSTE